MTRLRVLLWPTRRRRRRRIAAAAAFAVLIVVLAIVGTLFGVATSLGLGVLQVNAGLAYLFGIPETTPVQMILIAIITLMATVSVVAGLDAGIKRLSEWNLILALVLLVFGLWDDARELGHYVKFAGQFVAALLVVYYGGLHVSMLPV